MRGAVVGAAVMLAAAPAAGQEAPADQNAAYQYWVAFHMLPRFDQSNPVHLRFFDDWKTTRSRPTCSHTWSATSCPSTTSTAGPRCRTASGRRA